MNKKYVLTIAMGLTFSFLGFSMEANAQHKGISFQAVLKKSNGDYPTKDDLTFKAQILDPVKKCILREEIHTGKEITDGYFQIVLGESSVQTLPDYNPSGGVLTLSEVMDNTKERSGLKCVDENNNIISSNGKYIPSNLDGRILRVRVTLDGEDIAADFNMRSVGFAVNSEMLNSKSDTDFVNINNTKGVTQTNVESLFEQFTKFTAILSKFSSDGTGAAINISGTAANASNVTGVVALSNGGTGAKTAEEARIKLELGSVATINLPSADATSSYLRGDGQWVQVTQGGTSQVTASLPLSVTGTTTANISLAEASSATSGYLSKADWDKFNSKQEAGDFVTNLIGDVTSSAYAAGSVTTTIADDVITSGKIADGAVNSLFKIVSAPTSAGTNRLLATDPTTGTTIRDFSCSLLAPFLKWTGDATGFGCQALSLSSSDIAGFDAAVDTRISLQKGGANGVASLNADSRIPASQLGTGTADINKVLLGNGTWGDVPVSSPWVKAGNDIHYSAGKVGIGVSNPATSLHIADQLTVGESFSNPSFSTLVPISLSTNKLVVWGNGSSGGLNVNRHQAGGNSGAYIELMKSLGTASNPLPITTGKELGTIRFGGWYGSNLEDWSVTNAAIKAYASEDWSPTARGTKLQFLTSLNQTTESAPRMTIADNGNVGIGTTDPKAALDVAGHIRSSSGVFNSYLFNNSPAIGANFHGMRGRGTPDAITPAIAGDTLTGLYGGGYTGTDTASGWAGVIRILAAEDYSVGSTGTKIELITTPNGSITRSTRMTIGSDGNVGIGVPPIDNTKLAVNGAIVSVPNVPSGTTATVDLSRSNTHVLKAVGGSAITLNNMTHGGFYVLVIEDSAARTYTFSGCASIKFKPANSNTTVNTSTIYNILALDNGASGFKCLISWSTGFQ